MRKIGVNTIANIISKLWSTIAIYLFVPLYIKYLGESSYGLVSFFATLQATMNLLGLGLSNTLRREFAVGEIKDAENGTRKYKLLRSIELIYYFLGIIIFLICSVGSNFIASKWLNIELLDPNIVSKVLMLMGASIALQMVANLYAGCLFGMELQVRANIYCVLWSALKSIGSLAIIILIKADLVYFYEWHIIVDVFYLLVLRRSITNNLVYEKTDKWAVKDFSNLKAIWKYTLGILVISFIALINKQLDKTIISGYLSLTELGAYNTATTLGGVVAMIPAALYTSIFPRFTTKVSIGNQKQDLINDFLLFNKITNIFISCIGAFIAFFSNTLIMAWTHSDVYCNLLTYVSPIVVLAITVIEFQEIPYAMALAYGNTKINVFVGLIFIPFITLATWFGITNYGLLGAAYVYLIAMTLQTFLYEYLVYKKYITKNPVKLIIKDTVLPVILAILFAYISHYIVDNYVNSLLIKVAFAVFTGAISLSFSLIILGRKEMNLFFSTVKVKLNRS